jgi:hypothetical protein
MSSATATTSFTYTTSDIEAVVRRFTADLVMIAQSSRAISEAKAREYAHDIEALAKKGYLAEVDLTLLSGKTEVRAVRYVVNISAGDLISSRPGGVMWPQVTNAELRILLFHTPAYTDVAREEMKGRLKIGWVTTSADTSHAALEACDGRDYASNGWGMQRKDFK